MCKRWKVFILSFLQIFMFRMYNIGDGIPKDPDQAKIYLDKAKAMMEVMKKGVPGGTGFTG